MNRNFPTYNPTRKVGDKGVTFVQSIVEDEFDWIFRPVHLEDDFGLDGYFDIIGRENSVTGKYLGVQIKTGDSYFKTKKSFGWVYHGENKHLNYYLNSNFPVLIILVNLNERKAYWVEFDISKISRTNGGWSIIIPESNILGHKSKIELEKLCGDVIDYMTQIEYQWEITEKLKNTDYAYLKVSKEEILNKDISGFTLLLNKLTIDDEMIKKGKGKISFFIDGYNEDSRELYQIPEVREWVKIVMPSFKYWGYFLNMEDFAIPLTGLRVLHLCSVDVRIKSKNSENNLVEIAPNVEQSLDLLNQLFLWLNEFCEKYNINRSINEQQSHLIGKTLFDFDINSINK